ncbi:phage portal protein, HK97 family [Niallia circulans]|uniref:phage portal protein n=1 Tax=Niallia circulans TaxID=1397 RepID=UPI00077C24EA|nr:phage portal protein [Niallia circulans]MDR4318396.1 phage portal protein [Niallia circulans]MED3839284.1 phage portal protein [Niallia circulans]MED4242371.1 phage portal protein [Niallia circulans]MED4250473.1 phage portal protein [Niallia circulans]QKH59836.1 phage portal protein [Niallia circulans]
MGFFDSVLKRNSELSWMFDLELLDETTQRAYLKKMALETCINFIARTISQSDFRFIENGKRQLNNWHYLFNVRPNTDQSAADFWQDFTYRLIDENEILVIKTDSDDFLIADDFTRNEFAVYPDTFSNVMVKGYTFQRTYQMDEVIYLTHNNEKLSKFTDGMFDDYANLFSRMLEIALRNYQIRGMVGIDSTQQLTKENRTKLQNFIDKLFNSFKNNSIALVPKLKGFEYEEVASGETKGQPIDELTKLKRSLIDDVANILGIPNALIHGELAEYETAIKAYVKFCISPLLRKIQDELNAKLFTKKEHLAGSKVEARFIAYSSIFEIAESFDKLVASGGFSRNELRKEAGYEESDDPELDKFVITKNYQTTEAVKGGENE